MIGIHWGDVILLGWALVVVATLVGWNTSVATPDQALAETGLKRSNPPSIPHRPNMSDGTLRG